MAEKKASTKKPSTKRNTSVNMDEKSANAGDRMKHALSLEVLARTEGWPRVCYAETHAGAGVYKEIEQKPTQPHIRMLREMVLWKLLRSTLQPGDNRETTITHQAGSPYLELLRDWWLQPDQFHSYPGSARQAAEYLRRAGREFELRLTEADQSTCNRLRKAIREFPGEARHRSFHEELAWLTAEENLYVVVDPFRCVETFQVENIPESEFAIAKGDIDHTTLHGVLNSCGNKAAAVLQFWWPTTSQAGTNGIAAVVGASHKKTRELFEEWRPSNNEHSYRLFFDRHNHASALIGVGRGASIVTAIGDLDWSSSWLRQYLNPVHNAEDTEELD